MPDETASKNFLIKTSLGKQFIIVNLIPAAHL